MAEVLGVVSSAIAVAELAGKFGLSVMKLKQLWDEIQDIPEEMNRIMRQLEILKPVLAGMEADFVQQRHKVYFNSATNLQASIEYCRDAVNDLENLAEDLQARISTAKRSRRNITKLKVSFKKEDIRKYQERIGWALHLISLSQQSYLMAFMKSQTVMELVQDPEPSLLDTVVDDSHEVQTDVSDSDTSNSDRLETIRPTGYEVGPKPLPWQKPSFFGGFTYKQSQNSFYANSAVHQIRLQLPTWVSRRVFDLQTYRANIGWQICLKPWIKRDSNYGKTFNDVRYGKLLDVEKALAAGEASLFDRDRSGGTMLHIAAYGGKLETFRALLSWGLNPTEKDDYGFPVVCEIGRMGKLSNATRTGFFKLMIDAGALDEEIDAMFSGTWKLSAYYAFPRHIWKYPGILQMMVGDRYEEYLQLPPQARFTYLSWGDVKPELLLKQLSMGAGISPAALREVEGFYDNTPVNTNMAGKCLQMFARSYFCSAPVRLWEGLESVISTDEDHHFRTFNAFHYRRELARWYLDGISLQELTELRRVESGYLTPFLCGISCSSFPVSFPWNSSRLQRCRERRWMMQGMSRAMQFWLEDVQSAGIDLEEYGKRELAIYLKSSCTLRHRRGFGMAGPTSTLHNMRLVSFEYGPRPEDWYLVWDPDAYEFAGEFWNLIENPPLRIPGGWVDDA
ncbi:Ankyrin repeat-containing domain protein [Colletotrichum asianum]